MKIKYDNNLFRNVYLIVFLFNKEFYSIIIFLNIILHYNNTYNLFKIYFLKHVYEGVRLVECL